MHVVNYWVYEIFFIAGSSLHQLSRHIPKLLQYSSGLVFDSISPPHPSSDDPVTPHAAHTLRGTGCSQQITAVLSTHGERMNLNQVQCYRHTCTTHYILRSMAYIVYSTYMYLSELEPRPLLASSTFGNPFLPVCVYM